MGRRCSWRARLPAMSSRSTSSRTSPALPAVASRRWSSRRRRAWTPLVRPAAGGVPGPICPMRPSLTPSAPTWWTRSCARAVSSASALRASWRHACPRSASGVTATSWSWPAAPMRPGGSCWACGPRGERRWCRWIRARWPTASSPGLPRPCAGRCAFWRATRTWASSAWACAAACARRMWRSPCGRPRRPFPAPRPRSCWRAPARTRRSCACWPSRAARAR